MGQIVAIGDPADGEHLEAGQQRERLELGEGSRLDGDGAARGGGDERLHERVVERVEDDAAEVRTALDEREPRWMPEE